MISKARLESNRRNAKKSTDPRTEEGKRRSSLNAITHGMSAIALLPDEDPAAYDRRMVQWVQGYRPQNDGELFQAERAAYSAWLVQRTRRAQSARLVFKAQTALDEKQNREDRESMELALRLFRLPGGGWPNTGDDPRSEHRGELPGVCLPVERDEADHPALLVLGLEASESGCRWLLDRWSELKAVIEDEQLGPWQAPERFKAIRLLGLDTRDVMHAPAVISILQACQALDPDAGGLIDEFWNELVAANAGWSMERLRAWVPEMAVPTDQAAAREDLTEIVKHATDRLELKLKEHEEMNELEGKYAAHARAFDHSPEGERMRRYETTCNRYVDRYFSELDKRKSNRSGEGYSPASLTYARPRSQAFRQSEGPSESPEKAELTAFIDSIRKSSSKSEIRNPKGGETNGASGDAGGELRNEPKGAGASSSKSEIRNPKGGEANGASGDAGGDLRNEPKGGGAMNSPHDEGRLDVTPKQNVAAGTGTGRVLRNEPKPATGAGPHRGGWQPKAWDNSRRARRAREAIERTAGRRDVLCQAETRPTSDDRVIATSPSD
jgi:hypothetical protein